MSAPVTVIRKVYIIIILFDNFHPQQSIGHSDIPLCGDQRSDLNLKQHTVLLTQVIKVQAGLSLCSSILKLDFRMADKKVSLLTFTLNPF